MLGNLQVAAIMLSTPLLALPGPLLLLIGKTAFLTNVQGLAVLLYFFDHRSSPESRLI